MATQDIEVKKLIQLVQQEEQDTYSFQTAHSIFFFYIHEYASVKSEVDVTGILKCYFLTTGNTQLGTDQNTYT